VNLIRTNRTSILAGSLLALGLLGCSGGTGSQDSASSTSATPAAKVAPTPSVTAPATPAAVGNYVFFKPATEQDLVAHSHYGYIIAKTRPGFDPKVFEAQGLSVEGTMSFGKATFYHLHGSGQILSAVERLGRTQGVLYAHPDMKLATCGGITYGDPDPLTVSEQYSAYITHAMDAWTTYGFGSATPVIVDVDTGVNWTHEDFQKSGSSTVTHAFSWWDLSNNTFIDSGRPIDYINTAVTCTDDDSHGSHTMGTLGAQGDNGKGVAGVCWQAELVSYKCFNNSDGNNSGSEWAIYGSVVDLVQNRSNISTYTGTIPVNMSLGGSYAEPFDVDVIQYGLANNVVIICAMGNSGQEETQYPAAYDGVIAVGATDGQDQKAAFSTTGAHISVCAPGLNIISTGNASNSEYFIDSGTSMATPFVTGLAGYMLTFDPNLTPAQIKTELETCADPLGGVAFSDATGYGRVNVLTTIKDVSTKAAAGTAIAQNYSDNPLNVALVNTLAAASDAPVIYTPVYLYSADASGNLKNYVGCGVTDDQGLTAFSLLPAGNYIATAVLAGHAYSTPVVAVTTDDSQAIAAQTLGLPITYAQVLNDMGASQLSDGLVALFDGSGNLITEVYASSLPDFVPLDLSTAGTYYLAVMPYDSLGEYALYLAPDVYSSANWATIPTAPGSFANPTGGSLGSQSQAPSAPQAISLDALYYGNLCQGSTSAAGDFYQIQSK
jgi:thermitase